MYKKARCTCKVVADLKSFLLFSLPSPSSLLKLPNEAHSAGAGLPGFNSYDGVVLGSHLELVPDMKPCTELLTFASSDAVYKTELELSMVYNCTKQWVALELIKTVSKQGTLCPPKCPSTRSRRCLNSFVGT